MDSEWGVSKLPRKPGVPGEQGPLPGEEDRRITLVATQSLNQESSMQCLQGARQANN